MWVDGEEIPLKSDNGYPYPRRMRMTAYDSIKPNYGSCPDGYWFKEGGFDRDPNTDHLEDFRWVVDFADPRFDHRDIKSVYPRCGMTYLEIEAAIFYNKAITKFSMIPVPQGADPHPWPPIGSTNDKLGADVRCKDTGEVRIEIPNHDPIPPLKKKWAPRSVVFTNLEPEGRRLPDDRKNNGYEKGDFFVYYEALETSGPKRWDIWGPPNSVDRNGRIDCDSTFVSTLEHMGEP
jgi:hypothetical protein